jgi:hypothetical protein
MRGSLAWLDRARVARHPAGVHDTVDGEVREPQLAFEGDPLVFRGGRFGELSR